MDNNSAPQNVPNFKNIIYATADYKNSIIKRKKKLATLLDSFNHYRNSIIGSNQICYNLESNESTFLEILPVNLSIKNAIANLDTWSRTSIIETTPSIHQKTFSTYTPKGLVAIVLKTQLPFYYLFNALTSVVAAGNKAIIYLVDYPEAIEALIKTIVGVAFNPLDVCIITSKQKVDGSIRNIDYDYYTIISDTSLYNKIAPYIADSFKINFLDTSSYKSCLIIDESSPATQKMDKIIYSSLLHQGELFFNNNLFLIHVDQLVTLKISIANIQKKIANKEKSYLIKPTYKLSSESLFNKTLEQRKEILKDTDSKLLLGDTNPFENMELSPTIIEVSPQSEFWKWEIKGPLILVLPFYNIKDAIHHLRSLPTLNKIHLFSKSKFNINAVTANLETELFLINELFMDKFNLNTIQPDNKAFYKGISGYAAHSNLKTVSIKKQNTNFEKLLLNKMDFISKKWFDLFFFRTKK